MLSGQKLPLPLNVARKLFYDISVENIMPAENIVKKELMNCVVVIKTSGMKISYPLLSLFIKL
jgi:hypothetical protein